MLTHKELKARALKRADVKAEYARLDEEFVLLDEFLKEPARLPVSLRRRLPNASGQLSPQ